MLCKVTHYAGLVSVNTRPHQLCWGDQEMGTAVSCIECSQLAGLISNSVETPQKHCLFMHLFFVQLFFIQGLYIVIVIINHHVLLVCKHVCVFRSAGGTASINGQGLI